MNDKMDFCKIYDSECIIIIFVWNDLFNDQNEQLIATRFLNQTKQFSKLS